MTGITSLLVVSAIAATVAQDDPSDLKASTEPASLSFKSKDQMLVGSVYGIEAVDGQPRLYGQRLAADVPAGRRTVSYACPGMQLGIDGARLTFEFEAGGHYALVCHVGRDAEILRIDDC